MLDGEVFVVQSGRIKYGLSSRREWSLSGVEWVESSTRLCNRRIWELQFGWYLVMVVWMESRYIEVGVGSRSGCSGGYVCVRYRYTSWVNCITFHHISSIITTGNESSLSLREPTSLVREIKRSLKAFSQSTDSSLFLFRHSLFVP